MLDTREYLVELADGKTEVFMTNQIADNLWAQCDSEGREFMVIYDIVGHRKNAEAIENGSPEATHVKLAMGTWHR